MTTLKPHRSGSKFGLTFVAAASVSCVAELDYAFIAEFAKVESGKLTVVGASYTEISARSFPTQHFFSCAGRVRMALGEPPADL